MKIDFTYSVLPPPLKTYLDDDYILRFGERPPSHCCQACGENVGCLGRFVFRFLHDCPC